MIYTYIYTYIYIYTPPRPPSTPAASPPLAAHLVGRARLAVGGMRYRGTSLLRNSLPPRTTMVP